MIMIIAADHGHFSSLPREQGLGHPFYHLARFVYIRYRCVHDSASPSKCTCPVIGTFTVRQIEW